MMATLPRHAGALTARDVQDAPLDFLRALVELGDLVGYAVDGREALLVNRPDLVKQVLQEEHRHFVKQGTPDMFMLTPMLGEGLLTSDGDVWYRQRRMTQPAFHRERVASCAALMAEETARSLDAWAAPARAGAPLEISDAFTQLTTRIVARALFASDVTALVGAFGDAVQAMNEFMGHYDPSDRRRMQRFQAARVLISSIVQAIIEQGRAAEEDSGDFLSVLLAARDEATGEPLAAREVRDQVMTLLMAGHETTAKVLTWACYLLDRHPEHWARLRAEAASLGDATPGADAPARLPHTWMVLQEAMRLYPPVWILSRVAASDTVLDGHPVARGTLVVVSPYFLHRHPDVWEEPEAFRPERFAADAPARPPFAFMPFSGGPRQCIGKPFATLEAVLVLAMLVRRFEPRVAAGHTVEPEALVTLRPQGGLPVTLHPVLP